MFNGRSGRIALVCLFFSALVLTSVSAFAQTPFFTPGNLVVTVEGCGVHAGNCTSVPNGTGTGAGNSTANGYGDNQAAPLTLFQYTPTGTSSVAFVNSLALPQTASGANTAVSGEYGSSSEGTLQLSGAGQYLTIMGYGVSASAFNANPTVYGPADAGALAQSGSLTGQSYTPIPRVVTLIDANGNVNSSTAVYNVFNGNNPRSAFTATGSTAYISGQGTSGDTTSGVFYVPVGSTTTAPTSITGADAGGTATQDTRTVQIFNNTLYVSMDSKSGSYNRSYLGSLGSPPATSAYTCTPNCPTSTGTIGPAELTGLGNTGGTGKVTLTATTGNNLNPSATINLSPVNYFFASPSVVYIADGGQPKNNSNGLNNCTGTANIGDGGLQKWVNSSSNGTGTWSLKYTLYQGLNLVNNCGTTGSTGLYGLTGVVSGASVYLYATNYNLSDYDYTYLYGITDTLANTTPPGTSEAFTLLATAPADSNFKGVSFAPSIPAGDVEVTSVPSGLAYTSSGTGCAPGSYGTPLTLAWTPASSCTLTVTSPQSGGTGVQYTFSQWDNGTTNTARTVTAPSTTATYTATFNTQYLLTTAAGTGGSVSAGGYYTSGASASITATASQGYCFVNFTGTSTSTTDPFSLTMNSPQTITANFASGSGLYSPASGSTFASTSATFSWCTNPNATAYWLDLGKEAGGSEYEQSGSLPVSSNSLAVTNLPNDGSTIYATFYSYVNGSWVPTSYSYTASGGSASKGVITSPAPGSTLTGSTATFNWSAGSTATAYWIDAGSSAGGSQYLQSGNIGNVTTETINNLPTNGSPVYITLYSYVAGSWLSNAYTYTAYNISAATATMQTPTPGSTLPGYSATFTWIAGSGASAYWLDVGSNAGGSQYEQSGNLGNATSTTVNSLPTDGSTVYVTLYSLIGSTWVPNAYTYYSLNATSGLAAMRTPTPGSSISGTSATFTWSADPNATAYWVDISAVSAGGNDVYQSGNLGNALTTTVNSLPANGSTIYVTLYSYVGGQWLSQPYTYTSAPAGSRPASNRPAGPVAHKK